MKTISRYLMTLALLITAVGGAWAQDPDYDIDVHFDDHYNPNQTPFDCRIMNLMYPEAEIKGTLYLSVDGDLKGTFPVNGDMFMGNIDPLDAGDHTWSAEFKPEGGGSFKRNGNFKIKKAYTSIYYNGSTSINLGVGESTELDVYMNPSEAGELSYSSSDASVASITKESSFKYIIQAKAAGTATITFSFAGSTNYNAADNKTITVTVLTPPIDVTTDAAEEGATFTEASFEMPTNDVTVNYELVRDMSVKMSAEVGDGNNGYRIRIKKDGNDFVPVKAEEMLVSVSDDLDEQHPIDLEVNTDFTLLVQKKGEGDTWTDLSNEDKLSVGTFRYKVTGTGNYDGTIYSNEFKLFEGYEVEVPAGEYVTYYKDEALYVEDEDAKLYTITTVSGTTATADELTIAPANTPILVKNNSTEKKTILLIPTTEETDANITVYSGFKGTTEAAKIAASTDSKDNYAFNGKEFVRVTEALDIAANKAWLEVSATASAAPQIRLIFNSATGIERVDGGQLTVDSWYSLDGRRLPGKPTKKGIYIVNGKKVVIK